MVEAKAITQGNFLVGEFQRGATIYDGWAPMAMVSIEHTDFFIRNMVVSLAEERLALAIKQPKALTFGAFAWSSSGRPLEPSACQQPGCAATGSSPLLVGE